MSRTIRDKAFATAKAETERRERAEVKSYYKKIFDRSKKETADSAREAVSYVQKAIEKTQQTEGYAIAAVSEFGAGYEEASADGDANDAWILSGKAFKIVQNAAEIARLAAEVADVAASQNWGESAGAIMVGIGGNIRPDSMSWDKTKLGRIATNAVDIARNAFTDLLINFNVAAEIAATGAKKARKARKAREALPVRPVFRERVGKQKHRPRRRR